MITAAQIAAQTSWKPTKRQEEFLSLPDNIFEALYGGQAGGGKSEILLMTPIVREFHKEPRFKGLILRRTSPELERELIVRSQVDGFYNSCGGQYNGQHKRWTFPSGAIIQFGHFEYEKDAKIYDSAQYNYIAFDEVTSFTPYQYEYLTYSRCRTSSNLPAFVRAGTNPGGVSHNYFRKRFVEPCREGSKLIRETKIIDGKSTTVYIIFVKSKATDNDYLMKNDPGYLDRMQRLPEDERIAKAEGDWWIYSGQVFDDFRDVKFPSEPDNALHVISPFTIPYYWPRVISIDWGFAAMTHVLWWAINPSPCERYPAKLYIYREYAATKEKISTWAANCKQLSHGENLIDVVLDPSAFGHRGDEKNIAEQFADYFGRSARPADNERLSGKVLLQEYLRWKRNEPRMIPVQGYDVGIALNIRRTQGEAAVLEYEKLFLKEEDEGFLPKLQIFDGCEKLINCIPLCVYNKDSNKTEDVAEFSGDDPYDNIRYGLKACQFYLSSGSSIASQEAERAKILDQYQGSSATGFYMAMDALENKIKRSSMPVNRRRYGTRRY